MAVEIDDQFWLKMAKTFVDESRNKIATSATNLMNFIQWAFPIYTASSIFTIEYNKVDLSLGWLLLFGLPYIALFVSYMMVVHIDKALSSKLDPRVPFLIKRVYETTVLTKIARLKDARTMVWASALFISMVLCISFMIKNRQVAALEFEVSGNKTTGLVAVYAKIPDTRKVDTSVSGIYIIAKSTSVKESKGKTEVSNVSTTDTIRVIYVDHQVINQNEYKNTFQVSSKPVSYTITLSWMEGDVRKSIEKILPFAN